jgi:hypothetical protein
MRNIQSRTTFTAWVKNVYRLRTGSGMNRGYVSFSYTAPVSAHHPTRVQVLGFTQVTTALSAVLSTVKMSISHPLTADLYPVSTVPTMKRMKENKERNS